MRALKKKTKPLARPLRFVNFNNTKLITVTDNAKTVRKPVFMPKIRKSDDATSPGLLAERFARVIFSGDANLGTLRMALAKNKTNIETDTVLT
ncbi:hypothetical protein [Nitrosopumilus sp.]|uniref:hypothetical protein n=1 Tax=Nitrosopumilus sp. TaxID=2024843 RepID=UPI00247B5F70|nr:hypothetical protein [Nitrosopumilus sp.]MCV0431551.1 hypothetical protein [Nitrosopumilus sp.]